jgi:hypothetical protein
MKAEPVETLKVGGIIYRRGFFTKMLLLGDPRNGQELERRLGYAPGRLRLGWYLLLLQDGPPSETEFAFAGYSYFSGGKIRGQQKDPNRRGPTVEESLRGQGIDVMAARRRQARGFTVEGAERICKIVPAERDMTDHETAIQQGKYWNKDLNPIAQWILLVRAKFLVERYFPGLG